MKITLSGVFALLCLSIPSFAFEYTNPAKSEPLLPCTASNIRTDKFKDAPDGFRTEVCKSLDRVVAMLNSPMSDGLANKTRSLWDVFLSTDVTLEPKRKDISDKVYGLVEVYESNPRTIRMTLFLNEKKFTDPVFPYAFLHELQHVADYKSAWEVKGLLSSYDTEVNAFRVTSHLAQEMEKDKKLAKDSLFWNEKWLALSDAERNSARDSEIEKFLKKCGIYKSKRFSTKDTFDFSMIIRPDPPNVLARRKALDDYNNGKSKSKVTDNTVPDSEITKSVTLEISKSSTTNTNPVKAATPSPEAGSDTPSGTSDPSKTASPANPVVTANPATPTNSADTVSRAIPKGNR